MKTKYFQCQCHSPEHTLQISIDDDGEVYTSVFLNHYKSFYHRIWIAVKYVFGYRCQFGHWDCSIIKPEDLPRLKEIAEEGIKRYNEKKENLQHRGTEEEAL